jgi:hypothetical protein
MRLIIVLLALGAIGWMFLQASGPEQGDGALPAGYQDSLEKARDLEQSVQDAADNRLQNLDSPKG